jgi:hypothetical protein
LSLIGLTLGSFIRSAIAGASTGAPAISSNTMAWGVLFTLGAFAFETREIHWTGELILALTWLVLVLSIAPPLRGDPVRKSFLSGAGRDRLLRLHPFW